jgi:hypothetical protein
MATWESDVGVTVMTYAAACALYERIAGRYGAALVEREGGFVVTHARGGKDGKVLRILDTNSHDKIGQLGEAVLGRRGLVWSYASQCERFFKENVRPSLEERKRRENGTWRP